MAIEVLHAVNPSFGYGPEPTEFRHVATVDIDDDENLLWGIFTRFDAVLDVMFSKSEFRGLAPVYSGVMGIDATWKQGYQKPLVMDPEIVKKVDSKWSRYWK